MRKPCPGRRLDQAVGGAAVHAPAPRAGADLRHRTGLVAEQLLDAAPAKRLGEPGIRYFGVLIGFVIPIINVLAVSTLIWHSGNKGTFGQNLKVLLKALISNPLILGCLAGILFSRSNAYFPVFIDNTFSLMTAVTMPLALISIGGSLTLEGLKHHTKNAFLASMLKGLILPVIGFFLLNAFSVTGIAFKAGMIFFALPTSTAIYVLSAQLNSDTQLASATIMMSTLLSVISLSAALLI